MSAGKKRLSPRDWISSPGLDSSAGGNTGVTRMKKAGTVLAMILWALGTVRGQSPRPGMGAVRYADGEGTGVTFRTWAPHAASVSVAGEFNGWSTAAHPMTRESAESGLWSADVPGAAAGQAYKFVINGNQWRRDPCSRLLEPDGTRNSLVFDGTNYPWSGDLARPAALKDLVIYEAHVGTFHDPNPGDGQVGGFLDATGRLAHLAGLGVNAIEFMPVNEFQTDRSWGYNVYYPFAIETTYGSPADLKSLVRSCHTAGISVFMDVVHNHWGDTAHLRGSNPDDWSLWRYDGWFSGTNAGALFFTNAPFYASPWGPRPNYNEAAVRGLIRDTFRMWKDEYRLDGFRWDTPKHIIYTDWTLSVPIPSGHTLLREARADLDVNYPGTVSIAEDSKELSLFNLYWDPTFHDRLKTVMEQGDDNARNMSLLASAISGMPRRVIYTESHDTAGDLNGGRRFPMYMPWSADNGYYSRKRSMLAAVFAFTAPGVPMILQGQELMETNQFSDARPLDWGRTNTFGGAVDFYRDLVGLRRNLGGLTRGLQEETVEILRVDHAAKVIVYRRGFGVPSPDDVVVVANLRNTALENYVIPLPAAGRWTACLDSDDPRYGADFGGAGSTEVLAEGAAPTGRVSVGRYSALVLTRQTPARLEPALVSVDDAAWGNGNGYVDPGEGILTTVALTNCGLAAAREVSVTLTTTNPYVRLMSADAAYPDVPAGACATNAGRLHYRVATNAPCGQYVDFDLAYRHDGLTWTNRIRQRVGRPSDRPRTQTKYIYSEEGPLPIPDPGRMAGTIEVNEPGFHRLRYMSVMVRIDHSYVGDLELVLEHPDGTRALLCRNQGGAGQNFGHGYNCRDWSETVSTHFNNYGTQHISEAEAPFDSGEPYRPLDPMEDMFKDKEINGTWKLWISDSYATNSGALICWALKLNYYDPDSTTCDCQAGNRAPVPENMTWSVAARTESNFVLRASDPDQDRVRYRLAAAPAGGQVTLVDSNTGAFAYRPAHAFAGTDTFWYLADDGFLTSSWARVDIVVAPPADADGDGLPDWWETRYFGSATAAAAGADGDEDGLNNRAEYRANTHPGQRASCLRIDDVRCAGGEFIFSWPSVGGVRYEIEYADGLAGPGSFSTLANPGINGMDPRPYDEPGTGVCTQKVNDLPPGASRRFYRVKVKD